MPRRAQSQRLAMLAVSALLLIACAGAAMVLRGEAPVAEAALRLKQQQIAIRTGEPAAVPLPLPRDSNPRALLADALLRLRVAEPLPAGTARDALLAEAGASIAAARSARPWFGEAWMLEAFRASLAGSEARPVFTAALARSYVDAPYLKDSGGWRVSAAFASWDLIDPPTRRAAVNEAVWLARMSRDNYAEVIERARASDAYMPFMVEYMRSRAGDADFAPIQRPAPDQPGEK